MPAPSAPVTPENYFSLRPGDEYIVLGGKALPIRGLAGDRAGGCFYPNGGHAGYPVHTRRETHREAAARVQAQKAQSAPAVAHCGLDAQDWK